MVQWSYGQACGVYNLKYVGKFHSDSLKLLALKLPTDQFLQGSINEDLEDAYAAANLVGNEFSLEVVSRLTSAYPKKENLVALYKQKSPKFRLKLKVLGKHQLKEIIIELDWDEISVTELDKKYETTFEFDLHNITF